MLKKKQQRVLAYVIMPNHEHVILYFPEKVYNLNKIMANANRFMAYEIIERLKKLKRNDLLELFYGYVTVREKKKGQIHKVFEESFDAKGISSEKFLFQKLNYIHRNPVSGKWKLVKDYTEYEHSSASFSVPSGSPNNHQ